jgi:hypothetical protein
MPLTIDNTPPTLNSRMLIILNRELHYEQLGGQVYTNRLSGFNSLIILFIFS